MRPITLVLPHFANLGMLAEQQRIWAAYPPDLRAALHVVIVDDCSPKGGRPNAKAIWIEGLASIRVFRLTVKKRWNWLACRNLGAKVATTQWLLLTDIDHAIPADTLARIVSEPLDPSNAYRFSRVTATRTWPYEIADCEPYKAHNDTWFLTRALFFSDRVGGYDERLSGCYGTSGEFSDRVRAATRATVLLTEPIIRYPREIIPDASTPPSDIYTRKNDPVNDKDLAERKAKRADIPGWRPLHGLLPWEEIPLRQALEVA